MKQINECTLYNGDCLKIMNKIPDNSVDMVLCDLPYGTTNCSWDVVIPFDKLWEQYKRICKDNSAIVLFGSEPFSSKLRLSNIKMYKYDWIWKKSNKSTGFLNASREPLRAFETISVFGKKATIYNPQGVIKINKLEYRGGNANKGGEMGYIINVQMSIRENIRTIQ